MIFNKMKWIKECQREGRPFLLGFSGGSDSRALFRLLLESRLPFHIAHIDHRMRPSSTEEALKLRKEARELSIPFHLYTAPMIKEGNLEDEYRQIRIAFFKKIYKKINACALLLGHHQDDLIETTLKRVLEGARLFNLGAMKERKEAFGMTILRPLLDVPKKEILAFLEEQNESYIEDQTNSDPTYLRARMREQLLPNLEKDFGKKISCPLTQIAQDSLELNHYFEEKLSPYLNKEVKGPFGRLLKIEPYLHPIEIKWILSKWGLNNYRQQRCAVKILKEALPNKWVGSLYLDRGTLFSFPRALPSPFLKGPFKIGEFEEGEWEVKICESDEGIPGWEGLFQGKLLLSAPPKGGHLKPINLKKAQNLKVPAILRPLLPIVDHEGGGTFSESGEIKKFTIYLSHKTQDNFSLLC